MKNSTPSQKIKLFLNMKIESKLLINARLFTYFCYLLVCLFEHNAQVRFFGIITPPSAVDPVEIKKISADIFHMND